MGKKVMAIPISGTNNRDGRHFCFMAKVKTDQVKI
jgi:hypothetical protein